MQLWKKLEEKVRDYVRLKGEAYIITGPIFRDRDGDGDFDPYDAIGKNNVWVPYYCYKIIVTGSLDNIEVTAFLIPNTDEDKIPLQKCIRTVDFNRRLIWIGFFI